MDKDKAATLDGMMRASRTLGALAKIDSTVVPQTSTIVTIEDFA